MKNIIKQKFLEILSFTTNFRKVILESEKLNQQNKNVEIQLSIPAKEEIIQTSPKSLTPLDQGFLQAKELITSQKFEEAFFFYNKMIRDLDETSIENFNLSKAKILEKVCMLLYRTNDFEGYLFTSSCYIYQMALSFAFQGKTDKLKPLLKSKNKLTYLCSPSKIDGCFKKLKQENIKEEFTVKINSYFQSIEEDLSLISKKISKNNKSEEVLIKYKELNDDRFEKYFEENLRELF